MTSLLVIFCYTLLLHFFFAAFTSLSILFFAPFLVMCCYRTSLSSVLWWAFTCGLVTDLFSFHSRLGTYALINCLTVSLVYRFQVYFFIDRLSTLPIMTALYSFIASWIHVVLFYLNGYPFFLSWPWLKSNLLMTTWEDALYAGICFTLPSLWSLPPIKRSSSLMNLKRELR